MRYVMDRDYFMGYERFDAQHRQLFDALNGLLAAFEGGADREGLKKSLDFLSEYTIKHFFDEEQVLKKYGYSDLPKHRRHHEAFKQSVTDLAHQFIRQGVSDSLVKEVETKIGNWLIEHIKGEDFHWARELRSKAPELFTDPRAAAASVPMKTYPAPPPGGAARAVAVKAPPLPLGSPGAASGGAASPTPGAASGGGPAAPAPGAASGGGPAAPGAAKSAASKPPPAKPAKRRVAGIMVKLIALYGGLLILAFLTLTLLAVSTMGDLARSAAITVIEGKLKGDMAALRGQAGRTYGVLRLENGRLLDETGRPLEGRHEVIDQIAGDQGVIAGVFAREGSGFRRIATTLRDSAGNRLEGDTLDPKNAASKPLLAGMPYTGELTALGSHVIASYEPIFAPSGNREVIAALMVGADLSRIDDLINTGSGFFIRSMAIIALALILASALLNFGALRILFLRPVKRITQVMAQVEEGDISQQIGLEPGDEISEIAIQFDRTLDNLKRLVMIIQTEAEAVDDLGVDLSQSADLTTTAMGEIHGRIQNIQTRIEGQGESVAAVSAVMERITENIGTISRDITVQSERVTQSSSAIEEMLANIESVTRIIRNNGENVARLTAVSEGGRTGLRAVAEAMGEIARESEGLLEINGVLQSIASQTNLLSMNAAIEAAHAGDSGKGFAVVADEIRKLAESSGEQSKTIGTVLKKIRDSITRIAGATGEVLDQFAFVEADIKAVADEEGQIRDAMEEQSAGSKQILLSLEQLNEITQAVKGTSDTMREGSREIRAEGETLDRITGEISAEIRAIALRATEVNDSVTYLHTLSGQSSRNIAVLKEAISHFIIRDQHYIWDDSMALGDPKIDGQHRQIFDALNGLIDAIESGRGMEELKKSLDFINAYAATHFADEEALQERCGYPDRENHHHLHEEFKKTVQGMTEEFDRYGSSQKLVKEVKRRYGEWLVNHIRGQDSKIRGYVKKTKPR